MKLFPSEKFDIETGMTSEEVVERLKNLTDKDKFWNWYWSFKPYMGEVDEKGFHIITTIAGKRGIITANGFFCEIYGSLRESDNGTIISIDLRLNRLAKIFSTIWLTLVAIIFFGSLVGSFLARGRSIYFMLISVGFFIFGFLMMTFSFRMDARGVKARLLKTFR